MSGSSARPCLPFKDEANSLRDIVDAIGMIETFISGMDFEAFREDPKTVAAVERKLQIISEAAIRLGTNAETRFPGLPWRDITPVNTPPQEHKPPKVHVLFDASSSNEIRTQTEFVEGNREGQIGANAEVRQSVASNLRMMERTLRYKHRAEILHPFAVWMGPSAEFAPTFRYRLPLVVRKHSEISDLLGHLTRPTRPYVDQQLEKGACNSEGAQAGC